ncbi:MAG: polysaccharide biosynthesis/export family protein [Candidatus Sulfopaludibacter sp.]|nr:polysaccharide biosynthesis/export family protein [Candidatus Sulfopaludibacter sp.]
MKALALTAFLVSIPLFCPAGQSSPREQQPAQSADPGQKKAPQPPASGAPVSISPMIPVVGAPPAGDSPANADLAPGSPGAAAMAAGAAGAKPAIGAPVNTRTFIIGAEDVIAVSVFENTGFSVQPQAVRPDGKITMPLLGEIVAADKTPEELADEIKKILVDRYMKEPPHVQVIVVDVRSKNFYLLGEVNKPGKFPLVVPTTIMQALVNAGGFRDFANKKDIKIQRGNKIFKFNYVEASKGKHLEQNILLQPDDNIFVH